MFAMAPRLAKMGAEFRELAIPGIRTNAIVISVARTVDHLGRFVLALGLNRRLGARPKYKARHCPTLTPSSGTRRHGAQKMLDRRDSRQRGPNEALSKDKDLGAPHSGTPPPSFETAAAPPLQDDGADDALPLNTLSFQQSSDRSPNVSK